MKKYFKKISPKEFDSPEKYPASNEELEKWQSANKDFWESTPMRYDWNDDNPHEELSPKFYNEIDKRFFGEIKAVMPWNKIPFDNLIDFKNLKHKSILEIGVGTGVHADLIAPYSKAFIGIDITDYAVKTTSKRMKIRCTKANYKIIKMNAENLEFNDNYFDLVWSWGVIHHSANTKNIIDEIVRVLKVNGTAQIMVYHRGWWNYYIIGFLFHGILRAGFLKHKSLSNVVQANTDGFIARYYSRKSFASILDNNKTDIKKIIISGNRGDVIPVSGRNLRKRFIKVMPGQIFRFFLTRLRMGSLLIIEFKKK